MPQRLELVGSCHVQNSRTILWSSRRKLLPPHYFQSAPVQTRNRHTSIPLNIAPSFFPVAYLYSDMLPIGYILNTAALLLTAATIASSNYLC